MENWKKLIWNWTSGLFKCSAVASLSPSREPTLWRGLAVLRWVLLLLVDLADELDPEPETLRLHRRIPGCDQKPGGSGAPDPVSWREVWFHWCSCFNRPLSFQDFLTKEGGLMYWIGLSQSNGTWTWVDNTVLQKRWLFWFKFDFPALIHPCTCSLWLVGMFRKETTVFLLQVLGRGGAARRLRVSQDWRPGWEKLDQRKLSPAQLFHLPDADSVVFLHCYADTLPAAISRQWYRIDFGLSVITLHLSFPHIPHINHHLAPHQSHRLCIAVLPSLFNMLLFNLLESSDLSQINVNEGTFTQFIHK